MSAALFPMALAARSAMAMAGFQPPVAMLPRSCQNSVRWREKPAAIRLQSKSPRLAWAKKRLAEGGVARVVPMLPAEKADRVLPIVDRWTKIMRQVNG